MTHDLKTWPLYFAPAWGRNKSFEIRKNDRDFKVGDTVRLREFETDGQRYTGREIEVVITYVSCWEQKPGNVVFSFREIHRREGGDR